MVLPQPGEAGADLNVVQPMYVPALDHLGDAIRFVLAHSPQQCEYVVCRNLVLVCDAGQDDLVVREQPPHPVRNQVVAVIGTGQRHAISEWDVPLEQNFATGKFVNRPEGADKKRKRRLRVPSAAAKRLAASRGEPPLPTEEEALLKVVAASASPLNLPMVLFAIAQATRLGETMGIRWKDVDYEARTVTEGPEIRALMPASIAILKSIEPENADPEAFAFPIESYNAFKTRIGRIVKKGAARMTGTMKDLGYLADLTYHDLRHEATSRLAKVFRDSKDLMMVTGHIDYKSMIRYYQPDPTELAMVAEEYMLARVAGLDVKAVTDEVPLGRAGA